MDRRVSSKDTTRRTAVYTAGRHRNTKDHVNKRTPRAASKGEGLTHAVPDVTYRQHENMVRRMHQQQIHPITTPSINEFIMPLHKNRHVHLLAC